MTPQGPTPAERAAVEAALARGLVSPAQVQAAVLRQRALAAQGAAASLPALLRLSPPSALPASPSPSNAPDVPGLVVERELARGGMGAVYVAHEPALDRRVALKVLLDPGADPRAAARFEVEAQAAARLEHPGIVRVHAAGVDPRGRRWLTMDLVDGASLEARVREAGPLDPRAAAEVAAAVGDALAFAHARGVVHRDVKPANVLLTRDGRALLTDFGLARDAAREAERLTRTGELAGTPAYMAPEQVDDAKRAGPQADVYGLAATLYFALTARAPFDGGSTLALVRRVLEDDPTSPRALRPDLDPSLEAVVLAGLAKDPDRRPRGADGLAADLRRWLAGEAVAARPPGWAGRLGRRLRGRAGAAAVVAATLALGAGALAIAASLGPATSSPRAGPTPADGPRAPAWEEHARAAASALATGDPAAAIAALASAAAAAPAHERPALHGRAGEALAALAVADPPRALALAEASPDGEVRPAPAHVRWHAARAALHLARHEPRAAADAATEALALDPFDADAAALLLEAELVAGTATGDGPALARLRELAGGAPRTLALEAAARALDLDRAERDPGAVREDGAIELEGELAPATRLGRTGHEERLVAEAERVRAGAVAAAAAAEDDARARAWARWGRARARRVEHAVHRAHAQRLEAAMGEPSPRRARALEDVRARRAEAVREGGADLVAAVADAPGLPHFALERAAFDLDIEQALRTELGLPEVSAAALDPVVARAPRAAAPLVLRGRLHRRVRAWRAAAADFVAALALDPEDAHALEVAPETLERAGDLAGALALVTRSLDGRAPTEGAPGPGEPGGPPRFAWTLLGARARLRALAGDATGALADQEARAALTSRLVPDDQPPFAALALACGRLEDARDALQRFVVVAGPRSARGARLEALRDALGRPDGPAAWPEEARRALGLALHCTDPGVPWPSAEALRARRDALDAARVPRDATGLWARLRCAYALANAHPEVRDEETRRCEALVAALRGLLPPRHPWVRGLD